MFYIIPVKILVIDVVMVDVLINQEPVSAEKFFCFFVGIGAAVFAEAFTRIEIKNYT